MDVVADLPADSQPAKPMQMGEGPFHHPALGAETGAVLGAPAGDQRLHPKTSHEAAVLVVVVAAVGEQGVRPAPGTPARLPRTDGTAFPTS